MNKPLVKLVERLNRVFPHLEVWEGGYYFDDENNYSPPYKLDWFAIIEELKKNGLEIKEKIK